MRELVYYIAVSIDGYIAGPNGQFDAFLMEGDHMDYLTDRFPETIPTVFADQLGLSRENSTFDTVLMGWNTYAVGLPDGMDSPYSHLEQIVFSSSRHGEAENLTITDQEPVNIARALKAKPGGSIWLCGGANLATQLVSEIDRVILKQHPVLMGDGIPLFGQSQYSPQYFRLVNNRAFKSGVMVAEYLRKT